jgi:hypothetical protein
MVCVSNEKTAPITARLSIHGPVPLYLDNFVKDKPIDEEHRPEENDRQHQET